jgi:hypothetical protein
MKFDEVTPGVALTGLRPAPAQQWGGVRLIPLLRDQKPTATCASHSPQGRRPRRAAALNDGTGYLRLHAARLHRRRGPPRASRSPPSAPSCAAVISRTFGRAPPPLLHRLAKREDRNALRFVPLHLAMEGFLSLHFGGPDVAWTEYSPRGHEPPASAPAPSAAVPGLWLAGLADALRVFEIHERPGRRPGPRRRRPRQRLRRPAPRRLPRPPPQPAVRLLRRAAVPVRPAPSRPCRASTSASAPAAYTASPACARRSQLGRDCVARPHRRADHRPARAARPTWQTVHRAGPFRLTPLHRRAAARPREPHRRGHRAWHRRASST